MTSAEVILRVQYGTVPVPVPYVLTRVIQDAQSRKSLARAPAAGENRRLEFWYRYSTGIPYDFELILILILNCSTVVLNYTYVVEWRTVAFCYPGGQHLRIWALDQEFRIQR